MRGLVPPDEPAAAKPRVRGFVDDCHAEESDQGFSDPLYYYHYDHVGSEYIDYSAIAYYYYDYHVFEGIIVEADAQDCDIGRLYFAHDQPVRWSAE